MHVMTCGALAGRDRGMLNLPVEFLLVVTSKTEVDPCGEKKLLRLVLGRVRIGMAGNAPTAQNYGMEVFSFYHLSVARHADGQLRS